MEITCPKPSPAEPTPVKRSTQASRKPNDLEYPLIQSHEARNSEPRGRLRLFASRVRIFVIWDADTHMES